MHKPHLVNAVQQSELHPYFEVLPHADRASLRVGDVAKVCLRFEGHPEHQGGRFWVLIQSSRDGAYTGTVNNSLVHTDFHGFERGNRISFDHRHIYDLERGPFDKTTLV